MTEKSNLQKLVDEKSDRVKFRDPKGMIALSQLECIIF